MFEDNLLRLSGLSLDSESSIPFFSFRFSIIDIDIELISFSSPPFSSYGEQGMVVIHRALQNMFPNIPPSTCAPLEPSDFILRVLVPEAARILIAQDMGVGHKEAFEILLASRKYGLSKFPDRESAADFAGNASVVDVDAIPIPIGNSSTKASGIGIGGTSGKAKAKTKTPGVLENRIRRNDDIVVDDFETPKPIKTFSGTKTGIVTTKASKVPEVFMVEDDATPKPIEKFIGTSSKVVKVAIEKQKKKKLVLSSEDESTSASESAPKRARPASRARTITK